VKHALRRTCALACVLAFVALLAPGGASATNTIDCLGKTAKSPDAPDTLDYTFRCSEAITGYTIVTNRLLAAFEPEVLVTVGSPTGDPANGESFGCEGAIPGFGTSCNGKASAWNWASSEVHTDAPVCSQKEGPLLVRLVVTDFDKRISQPFPLRSPKCPKPKSASKHKKHPAKRKHAARRHH
jgi:hypothetical protein